MSSPYVVHLANAKKKNRTQSKTFLGPGVLGPQPCTGPSGRSCGTVGTAWSWKSKRPHSSHRSHPCYPGGPKMSMLNLVSLSLFSC